MKRRIVLVTDFGHSAGGAAETLVTFAGALDRSTWELTVVLLAEGELVNRLRTRGVHVIVYPVNRLRRLGAGAAAVWRLSRLLRARQVDVVLSWMPKAHLYAAPAGWLAGLGSRLAWHQSGGPPDLIDRVATLLPARAIYAYSAESAREQEDLWPHRPTTGVEPGIDEPRVSTEAELLAVRRRFPMPESSFVVGVFGRLQRWKGQDRVLRAVAKLRAEGRDVHALIVGGDPGSLDPGYGEEVRALPAKLGLDGHVTMTGHLDRPEPTMQLMDVMVNASHSEPFGLVLLEAMLAGVPVVAADAGGPADLIADGQNGLLMPDASPASIAAAVRRLMDAPELRSRVSANAPVTVRERYLAHHFAERMARSLVTSLG